MATMSLIFNPDTVTYQGSPLMAVLLPLPAAYQVSGLRGTDVGHLGQTHCSGPRSPHSGANALTRAGGTHGNAG